MTKRNRYILAISLIAVTSILGCEGFEVFKYDELPVVRATYQAGANRASVESAGGPPNSEIKVSSNQGTCVNYTLKTKKGATSPFFVVFTRDNRVATYGYTSCETALQRHQKMPSEPMKQIY